MILRYRLLVCFLLVFAVVSATACAPVPPETADSQSADSAAAPETTHEAEEEPNEEDTHEHEEDEHGEEDAGEHSEEDADEHSDEHEHAEETEHRELGAHEHGAAQLMIAWSGSDMAIDLQTPAYNVLGFEYAPTSEEEQAFLAESIAALEKGDLLQLSSDAECAVVMADVQTELADEAHDHEDHEDEHAHEEEHGEEEHGEEGHDDEADHEHGDEHSDDHSDDHDSEVHSDIDVAYNLECQQPDNIASLDASALFAQFPNFEAIQVQWVSDTQQSAATLTPDNPVIVFE